MEFMTFEELDVLHIQDLQIKKREILDALDEIRKERHGLIGQILFYQELYVELKNDPK